MSYTAEDYKIESQLTNADLVAFAEKYVNLPPEKAKEYRKRANSIRERLEKYINEHPDYNLMKMLHSGSLAKGTALMKPGDLDIAVYIRRAEAPENDSELASWMTDRLKGIPEFSADQLEPQEHCVKIIYPTGPSVDVVPVLYEGDPNDIGYLVSKVSGRQVMTSIPMHLEFIRKRKNLQKTHYVQLVRFIKYWVAKQRELDNDFRFKSFMVELICAKLCDEGVDFSDYAYALQKFFHYIVRSQLKEPIIFSDYYQPSAVSQTSKPIQIYDPVNPGNNVAEKYTDTRRQKIVTAAQEAFNAVSAAPYSSQDAVAMWVRVFGTSFRNRT